MAGFRNCSGGLLGGLFLLFQTRQSAALHLLGWTWPKVHGPYPVPYKIELDGVKTNIKCEGSLEIEGGPIRNPVTGAESRPGVVLPEGDSFNLRRPVEVYRGN
jgi:hypothetical protein